MKQDEIFPHLHWQDLSLSILYFVHEKETMPSDHCHAFYELVLVREGQAMHFMNGELAPIRAGNVFLVPPGKMHGYRDAQHLGIYNILFSEEILELFQHDLSNTPNYQMLFHVQPGLFSSLRAKTDLLALDHGHFTQAVTLADEIIREEKHREAGGRTLVFGEFLHLLAGIIRYAHIGNASEKTAVYQISRLLAEMDRNFARKWSLADMARFVRMSRSGFRQQFRAMTGVPQIQSLHTFADGICSVCGWKKQQLCSVFPIRSPKRECGQVFRTRTISRASSGPVTESVRANTNGSGTPGCPGDGKVTLRRPLPCQICRASSCSRKRIHPPL